MSVRVSLFLVSAVSLSWAAWGQPAPASPEVDSNCTFSKGSQQQSQRSGRVSIFSVGGTPNIDCDKSKDCEIPVKVLSYTHSVTGEQSCCVQVETGQIRVKRGDTPVNIKWVLAPEGQTNLDEYTFAQNAVVAFHNGNGKRPNKTDELNPPSTSVSGKEATVQSINTHNGPKSFNYWLNVLRLVDGGRYAVCDPTDPVIINNGR